MKKIFAMFFVMILVTSVFFNAAKANEISKVNHQDENVIFSVRNLNKIYTDDKFNKLLPETKAVIMNIIHEAENSKNQTLEGNIEIRTKIESLDYSMKQTKSPFIVKNQQVIYRRVSNEQPILSKKEKFGRYKNNIILNLAQLLAREGISKIPLGTAISNLTGIFSYDSSVDSWSDWRLSAKLHEEKVVQLSWVYDSTYPVYSPFLGAHTEFVTAYYEGLLSAPFRGTEIRTSPFYYIRTKHYNNPNNFAIEHRNDCYVERIYGYTLGDAYFNSLN